MGTLDMSQFITINKGDRTRPNRSHVYTTAFVAPKNYFSLFIYLFIVWLLLHEPSVVSVLLMVSFQSVLIYLPDPAH